MIITLLLCEKVTTSPSTRNQTNYYELGIITKEFSSIQLKVNELRNVPFEDLTVRQLYQSCANVTVTAVDVCHSADSPAIPWLILVD